MLNSVWPKPGSILVLVHIHRPSLICFFYKAFSEVQGDLWVMKVVKQSLYPCKLSFIIFFISIYRLDTLSIIFFEFLTDQMSYFFCTSKIKHRGAIVCKRVRIFTSFYDEFAGVIFPIFTEIVFDEFLAKSALPWESWVL